MMDNTRAQFEHWFSDEGTSPRAIERGSGGRYKLMAAAQAWSVWQVATSVAREACANACQDVGFKVHGPGREDSEAFDCADAIRDGR